MATRKTGRTTKTSRARKSTKQDDSLQDIMAHFEEIKDDMLNLSKKIGMTKKSHFTKLSEDVAKKVSDSTADIMKNSADVLNKATKVMQFAALGAVEGGKKALEENEKPKPKRRTTARKTTKRSSAKTTKSAAAKTTRKPAAKKTTKRATKSRA